MTTVKMHVDEVDTDASLVRRLLAAQFPQWAELPIAPVRSTGTDNAIYRLGETLAARLPRIHWAVSQIDKERAWLPRLAPLLPLQLPVQLARGVPGEGYPYPWAVYQWLPGENATLDRLADPCEAATALARFILALQRIEVTGGLTKGRGLPLATRNAATREAIAALDGRIDTEAATAAWEAALQAPNWERAPVWYHGDLLPGNLLFNQRRLSAVIDFSGLAAGDPACDLMSGWALFAGESRAAFRAALGVDEATWARGRGHALAQALIFAPYYWHTNPAGVARALHTIREVLADVRANG